MDSTPLWTVCHYGRYAIMDGMPLWMVCHYLLLLPTHLNETIITSTMHSSTMYSSTMYSSTMYSSTMYSSAMYSSTMYSSTMYSSAILFYICLHLNCDGLGHPVHDWSPIPCEIGDGLFPAASFMAFQQVCFNFGNSEFRFVFFLFFFLFFKFFFSYYHYYSLFYFQCYYSENLTRGK
jgi:hypothetical protein